MNTADGDKMSGVPTPTPGAAEGTDKSQGEDQSQKPPSSHTPGSAEGEDDDEKTGGG
jgi:hypothetical protein